MTNYEKMEQLNVEVKSNIKYMYTSFVMLFVSLIGLVLYVSFNAITNMIIEHLVTIFILGIVVACTILFIKFDNINRNMYKKRGELIASHISSTISEVIQSGCKCEIAIDDDGSCLIYFEDEVEHSELEKKLKDEYYVINKIFDLDLTVDKIFRENYP